MTEWVAFAALTLALIAILLLLSIASARAIGGEGPGPDRRESRRPRATAPADPRLPRFEPATTQSDSPDVPARSEMSTGTLLANVALTQGIFGVGLLIAAVYFEVPLTALGIESPLFTAETLLVGIAGGVLLWIGNEFAAGAAEATGVGYDESVRSMLTPDSIGGWMILLGVILPTIAIVEELLFRGAAIGAMAVGFDVPAAMLVVVSSLAFGGAHGAQGRIGTVVATALGLLLGAIFVLTGSLLVVIVAHYLVNTLEFVVHEGLDVDRPIAPTQFE